MLQRDPRHIDGRAEAQMLAIIEEDIQHALDAAGIESEDYDLEFVGPLLPPVRAAEGPRTGHRGGWGDRSGNLAQSYDHEVKRQGDKTTLKRIAGMDYSHYVDAHEGISIMPSFDSGEIDRMVDRHLREVSR